VHQCCLPHPGLGKGSVRVGRNSFRVGAVTHGDDVARSSRRPRRSVRRGPVTGGATARRHIGGADESPQPELSSASEVTERPSVIVIQRDAQHLHPVARKQSWLPLLPSGTTKMCRSLPGSPSDDAEAGRLDAEAGRLVVDRAPRLSSMSQPGCFSISFEDQPMPRRRKPGRTRRRRRCSPRPPSSHLLAKGLYTVAPPDGRPSISPFALEVNAVPLVAPATPSRDRGDAAAVPNTSCSVQACEGASGLSVNVMCLCGSDPMG